MTSPTATQTLIPLPHRAVIAVAGEERATFLHGLVSNSIDGLQPGQCCYAALLTPQGKFLHDMLVVALPDRLLLDVARDRVDDLLRRLKMYKLRSKVTLQDLSADWVVVANPDGTARFADGVSFTDPRHAGLGQRLLLPITALAGLALASADEWHRLRLPLGVPEPGVDIEIEKSTLLEVGMDQLQAIDWKKGCYIGQELTARTRYRGLLKKRLFAVQIEGPLPAPTTPVLSADDKVVGEMRSGLDAQGLALLRLEAVQGEAGQTIRLRCGEAWLLVPALAEAVATA